MEKKQVQLTKTVAKRKIKAIFLREATTRYVDNPFTHWILSYYYAKKFSRSYSNKYDGNMDREDHVTGYKNQMVICNIPNK